MEKYMIMKRILKGLSAFAAIIVALTACDSSADQTTYDGPEYVMFSDTMTYFPVSNSQDYFNVPVGSTVACSYDRTYAVEVDDQNSTAVEDLHFTIESNSVTIKAGELATNVRVKGIYEKHRTFRFAFPQVTSDSQGRTGVGSLWHPNSCGNH